MALRDARLIATQRDGKAVGHCCTPLGLEPLRGAGTPGWALAAEDLSG